MEGKNKEIVLVSLGVLVISLAVIGMIESIALILTTQALLILGLMGFMLKRILDPAEEKMHWYRSMLDSIPQPLSVTDLDMNWTFVNKAATAPLGVKLEDVLGQQCSNWGAPICKTENCGVNCLRKGKLETTFDQWGKNFRVDSSYLYSRSGEKVGHIEVVNETTEKVSLSALLTKVNQFVNGIDIGAAQVNEASGSLSKGATEQASTLEQISSAMTEISGQSSQNAENAQKAKDVTSNTNSLAQDGLKKMEETVESMESISQSSEAIKKIIKNIDDIAFQTNLLALNAAVEAARAGQHGKGFAVVAEEVRNLAGRSAKAAKETAELIEDTVNKIQRGNQFATQTSESLSEIANSIIGINDYVTKISDDSNNQASSVKEVNQGLHQIEDVTQNNSALAEETAAAATELSNRTNELRSTLSSNGGGEVMDTQSALPSSNSMPALH